jgi:D-alanine-D-alanine ligase
MSKKPAKSPSFKVLLICGGGYEEHDISLMSADYIEQNLELAGHQVERLVLNQKNVFTPILDHSFDCLVPCIHGPPGEDGQIQQFFDQHQFPYIGCGAKTSRLAFDKALANEQFAAIDVPHTPFLVTENWQKDQKQFQDFFQKHQDVFVKAASQGSSVGCYHVKKALDLPQAVNNAFQFSSKVLIEKTVKGRELECSVYFYQGKLCVTDPGEIRLPQNVFYDFDEKYNEKSRTQTFIRAENISEHVKKTLRHYCQKIYAGFNVRHLARMDFFLTDKQEILINEINTFPGMTKISLFPKMLEATGLSFADYLNDILNDAIKNS